MSPEGLPLTRAILDRPESDATLGGPKGINTAWHGRMVACRLRTSIRALVLSCRSLSAPDKHHVRIVIASSVHCMAHP
jgi:hypothetical protein